MTNNIRIIKNTVFLYVRMIVILLLKLYTSRIILAVLGVADYGIYTLVGGVIIMFSFLNSAMCGASQRYFNIALGGDNVNQIKKYFANSLNAHIIIAIVSVLIAEIFGKILITEWLNIPQERLSSAYIVYHFSVFATFFSIIRSPYNALILAYERMSFFAYISILETFLNLLAVWLLLLVSNDKLEMYAFFIMLVSLLMTIGYYFYCKKNFRLKNDLNLFSFGVIKEILSFSLWSTLSSFGNIATKQGLNIILNIFYGVTINAATGIMTQVSSSVYSFIQNFLVAVNPQLIKSYASSDFLYLKFLFFSSSKFSYYLMFFFLLPIILSIDELLALWLGNVPLYTSIFCILSLLALLVNTLGGPIWTVIQATGKIVKYQIFIFFVTIVNIPVYYMLLYFGNPPFTTLFIPIITNLFVVFYGFLLCTNFMNITKSDYCYRVLFPIIKVSISSFVLMFPIKIYLCDKCAPLFFVLFIFLISFLTILILIFFLGLSSEERQLLLLKVKCIYNKFSI